VKLRCLGYVGVEAAEPKLWAELGPNIFAFGLAEPGDDGTVYLRIDDRHHRIAIHPGEQDRLSYIGWEVAREEDLVDAELELTAAGVGVTRGSPEECVERRVEAMVHFSDPAGLRHEIFYGAEDRYRSFVPGRPHRGFVTGNQGMGHLVVVVPDADAMHQFLVNTLGFRMTDVTTSPLGKALFYHLNPRHHSIAVLSMPNMRGLHHIMVECNDLDDVGITNDLVQDRMETKKDLGYSLTLGRHATDRMLSIYVDTPSGFIIEYGWGGLRLDDANWTVTKTEFPAEVWGHKFMTDQLPGTVHRLEALSDATAG
jgi:extradiol dioxygenase